MPYARAFWVVRPKVSELRTQPLTPPEPGQVLVQALYSGISRGTESIVFGGRVPESEYARMRCPHQEGDFPGPVKYGYASVGRVLEGPDELAGRLVFCLYPHQSAYVVAAEDVIPLPEGVAAERAVLAANLETAINALWDARPLLGDRITIVGAGVVGALCAYLARRLPGAEVELVDVRPERAALASALGVRFALPSAAASERDLVFHASGTAAGLRTALPLAAADSSVIDLSWYGDSEVGLPLGRDFHARRLTLRSSQVGSISPAARPRWTHRRRLELALGLCRDAALDCLIDGESRFEALPETLETLATPASGALCHRIRYE